MSQTGGRNGCYMCSVDHQTLGGIGGGNRSDSVAQGTPIGAVGWFLLSFAPLQGVSSRPTGRDWGRVGH